MIVMILNSSTITLKITWSPVTHRSDYLLKLTVMPTHTPPLRAVLIGKANQESKRDC